MREDAKQTKGGTWIRVTTDKNGNDHVDIYDNNPREKHEESIHITIKPDETGKISAKSGDNPREDTDFRCFLTTACMRHMQENFDDNCEELTILRWFRDNFVSEEDIKHYYETAPIIVESINNVENCDIIYRYVYENVVSACVNAVKNRNYELAYRIYKNGVITLEKQFARSFVEQKFVKSLKLRINNLRKK